MEATTCGGKTSAPTLKVKASITPTKCGSKLVLYFIRFAIHKIVFTKMIFVNISKKI